MDSNGNGVRDENENGVGGVVVNLYDEAGNLVATATTDANGFYYFLGLQAGTYYLEFDIPTGYQFSPPGRDPTDMDDSDANPETGLTTLIEVLPGVNDPTWNAGIYRQPTSLEEGAEPDRPSQIFLPLIHNGFTGLLSSDSSDAPTDLSDQVATDELFIPLVRRTGLGTKPPSVLTPRAPPRIRSRPQPPPLFSCQEQLCLKE